MLFRRLIAILALLGLGYLHLLAAQGAWHAWQTRLFPTVDGTITQSSMTYSGPKRSARSHIAYSYSVDGKVYTCDRVRWCPEHTRGRDSERFPDKSAVKVFYNPQDPFDAGLDPGVHGTDLLLVLSFMPFSAIAWTGALVLLYWGRPPRTRTEGREEEMVLDWTPPLAIFSGGAGCLSFAAVFVVGFSGMVSSLPIVGSVLIVIFVLASWMALAQYRANRSERVRIRLDRSRRSLECYTCQANPKLRNETPLRLKFDELQSIALVPSRTESILWLCPKSGAPQVLKQGSTATLAIMQEWLCSHIGCPKTESLPKREGPPSPREAPRGIAGGGGPAGVLALGPPEEGDGCGWSNEGPEIPERSLTAPPLNQLDEVIRLENEPETPEYHRQVVTAAPPNYLLRVRNHILLPAAALALFWFLGTDPLFLIFLSLVAITNAAHRLLPAQVFRVLISLFTTAFVGGILFGLLYGFSRAGLGIPLEVCIGIAAVVGLLAGRSQYYGEH